MITSAATRRPSKHDCDKAWHVAFCEPGLERHSRRIELIRQKSVRTPIPGCTGNFEST
jgi:hypothetical protein